MRLLPSFAVLLTALSAHAFQQSAPPSEYQARPYDTGPVSNTQASRAVVASFPVEVPDATWLRLSFSDIQLSGDQDLGTGSWLRVTSMLDGASQVLHARSAREYGYATAYFNGGSLLVELVSEPGTGPNRAVLAGVTAGLQTLNSICGGADNRVLSSDPRAARALPIGCTSWLINDCGHCFLTAGHCMSGMNLTLVQFNVPLSDPSGFITHPPPEDQYPVDPVSTQFVNGGVGNDWGRFGCFANSNTGQKPFQRQQAAYVLAAPPPANPSLQIRITGYGYDSTPSTWSQVQQTHAGSYVSWTGNTLVYQADTMGGNSGSPVILDATNVAIGIHTHGGCDVGLTDGNKGTSILNLVLQNALANPLGVCNVPCGGSTFGYCTAKVNSQGCTPLISSAGTPTQSGGRGSFWVMAGGVVAQRSGMLLYSLLPAATPFQGGTLCVASPFVRTPLQNSGGGVGCSGQYAYDMGARIASGLDANLHLGTTAYAQWYQRDPASPSGPVGMTAGLAFTIGP